MTDRGTAEVMIEPAAGPADMTLVRALFREYADWLDFDICFQGFEEELASLPGSYAPPRGGLWLARVDGELAGVVGFRPLEGEGACELKRLWVRPACRGHGLGRRLTETAIAAARSAGSRVMRLDTVGSTMQAAGALYRDVGFREIPAYYDNPHPEVAYLELDLSAK